MMNKVTDKATLAHLNMIIQRSNGHEKVKVQFCLGSGHPRSLIVQVFAGNKNHLPSKHPSVQKYTIIREVLITYVMYFQQKNLIPVTVREVKPPSNIINFLNFFF